MRVTYVGQSTFKVEAAGAALLIDPGWLARIGPFFLTTPAYRRAGRTLREGRYAGVLHTHTHVDHFEPRTLRALRRTLSADAPLVFPALALPFIKHGRDTLTRIADARSAQLLPFVELTTDLLGRARYLSNRATMRLGPFTITAVPMDHGYSIHGVRPIGCGYIIESGGQTIYHAGDCIFNREIVGAVAEMCGRPTLMMAPVGFYKPRYNNPRDAAQFTTAVRPRAVAPMHFGVPWERPHPEPAQGKGDNAHHSHRAGSSESDSHAWREALPRIDVGIALPGIFRPFLYGTLPEFAEELQIAGAEAQLCALDRLETLDLDSLER